jgi:hypothetical protein
MRQVCFPVLFSAGKTLRCIRSVPRRDDSTRQSWLTEDLDTHLIAAECDNLIGLRCCELGHAANHGPYDLVRVVQVDRHSLPSQSYTQHCTAACSIFWTCGIEVEMCCTARVCFGKPSKVQAPVLPPQCPPRRRHRRTRAHTAAMCHSLSPRLSGSDTHMRL